MLSFTYFVNDLCQQQTVQTSRMLVSLALYFRNMMLRLRLGSACGRAGRSVLRVVAWIPVLFVVVVLVWGYYVYVYVMNISGECAMRQSVCLSRDTSLGTFPKGSQAVNIIVSGKSGCGLVSIALLLRQPLLTYSCVRGLRSCDLCPSTDVLPQNHLHHS